MQQHTIRRFDGGGLGNIADPNIPTPRVEVYIRDQGGDTFYVPTLYEGILHLLSNAGSRITISEWPDGPGLMREQFTVRIFREGNQLFTSIDAPCLQAFPRVHNGVAYNLEPRPAHPGGSIQVVPIDQVLGGDVQAPPPPVISEMTVTIDGT